jgi:hypothetical protein
MVPMPLALVRLIAEYARADEIDFGNMFVLSNDTLFLCRMSAVASNNEIRNSSELARLNGWDEKYNINMDDSTYEQFFDVKILTKNVVLMPCWCKKCGCENAAKDDDVVCELCIMSCKCPDCDEFEWHCDCDE